MTERGIPRRDQRSIGKYIEQDPIRSENLGAARLKHYRVHVWTLVASAEQKQGRIRGVAADYDLPVGAVRAALVYYQHHKKEINAELNRVTAPW